MDDDLNESSDPLSPADLDPGTSQLRRFTELCEESQTLLDNARALVVEMREMLADCRQRRPVVEKQPVAEKIAAMPAGRSHRGGRVAKSHRRSRIRRRPR